MHDSAKALGGIDILVANVSALSAAEDTEASWQAQFDIDMDGLRQLIGNPFVIPVLSDGGAHLKYLAAGSYGTEFISRYVRDTPLTTLEEAHWRPLGAARPLRGIP